MSRLSNPLTSEYESERFFPNQIDAGVKVIRLFESNKRHVYITAEMQSGKTGTFHYIARNCLLNNTVESVYLICGMSDTKMYTQAIQDTRRYNADLADKIHVIYLQHIKHTDTDFEIPPNSLIITDESDRDSTKDSLYHKLMIRSRIPVDGNNDQLMEKNTYMLNVSATPYAEHIDSERKISHMKHRVRLLPGEGYWGIEQYYATNNIHKKFHILAEQRRFSNIINTYCVCEDGFKYAIIRYDKRSYKFSLFEELATTYDWKLHVIRSDYSREQLPYKTDNINELLETTPERPSIILISGMYRAGYVFSNKTHIGLVWEDSDTINLDACMQGLPGRVCGYDANPDTHIFVAENILKPIKIRRKCVGPDGERFDYLPSMIERHIQFHQRENEAIKNEVIKFKHAKKEPKKVEYATNAFQVPLEYLEMYGIMSHDFRFNSRNARKQFFDLIKEYLTSSAGETFFNNKCLSQEQKTELTCPDMGILRQIEDVYHAPERYSTVITIRHAKRGQYQPSSNSDASDIVTSVQRSCYLEHPVRNNQGVRTNQIIPIVVTVVEPDFEGRQDSRYKNTERRVVYVFFRTNSKSIESYTNTNGEEMYRCPLPEIEETNPSNTQDGTESVSGSASESGSGSASGNTRRDKNRIKRDGSGGRRVMVLKDIEPIQNVKELYDIINKYTRQYLDSSNEFAGIIYNPFRVTRKTRNAYENTRETKTQIEKRFNVKIVLNFSTGVYRADDTKQVKLLKII